MSLSSRVDIFAGEVVIDFFASILPVALVVVLAAPLYLIDIVALRMAWSGLLASIPSWLLTSGGV